MNFCFCHCIEIGKTLLDFGKVGFGYLELEIDSASESNLIVHLAERGDPSGAFRDIVEPSTVRYYKTQISIGKGRDTYAVHPPKNERNTSGAAIRIPGRFGRISPFRFVEIEPAEADSKIISASQIMLSYPFDDHASYFESSSSLLNDIWDLCKYSMKATSFAGVYVDGDRERIPYEADAYINQLSHYAVDSEYTIARHSQEYLMDYETWPTEWKQHSVMMAYKDYLYTGDITSIQRSYDLLKEKKTLETRAREDGLLVGFPFEKHWERTGDSADIVDWPDGERNGYEFKGINTVINAFHYLNLRQMAEMATAIGRDADAAEYAEKAERLRESFNAKLFDEYTGLYRDGEGSNHFSLHANLFPLAFGLVPEKRIQTVADFVVSKGMGVSVYAAQYLLEALYKANRPQAALDLITSTGKRSWANMLAVGTTITLEAWDDIYKPNQDWNHAWGAAPANIVSRYLLGVRPLSPGFSEILIAPRLGKLTSASGKIPTIRGPVFVAVDNSKKNKISVEVSLPGNSTGTVSLVIPKDASIQSLLVDTKQSTPSIEGDDLLITGLQPGKHLVELYLK